MTHVLWIAKTLALSHSHGYPCHTFRKNLKIHFYVIISIKLSKVAKTKLTHMLIIFSEELRTQVFFKMSALKYCLKFIEKYQQRCVLLRKVNAYSPRQNILQWKNKANLGKTRKPWYLYLQKFWLLLPKIDLVYVLSLFMSYHVLVIKKGICNSK